MHRSTSVAALLLALGWASPATPADAPADEGWTRVPMEYSSDEKEVERIVTPDPTLTDIAPNADTFVPLYDTKSPGGRLCTVKDKRRLLVDFDDDGKADREPGKDGVVKYKIREADAKDRPYHVKFFVDGITWLDNEQVPRWRFKRACFYRGTVEGETVTILDEDCNGRFDDLEKDAVMVGKGGFATLLGNAILVKDRVWLLKVDPAGTSIQVKLAAEGAKTGTVDFLAKYKHPKLKPQAVVVQSSDGLAFNALTAKKPAALPAGEYKLVMAMFTDRVMARAGDAKPIKVEEGKATVLEWGGPMTLSIDARAEVGGEVYRFTPPAQLKSPSRVRLDPARWEKVPFVKVAPVPRFLGAAGEEYYGAPRFKDSRGHCLADGAVKTFGVEILPLDAGGAAPPKGTKPLNKTGNTEHEAWKTVDLSGLVQRSPDWWEIYQCPVEGHKGKVRVRVWVESEIFGKLEDAKVLELP